MVVLWEAEEALAQLNRLEDPAAMDIYEVRLEKGKCPAPILYHSHSYLYPFSSNQKAARVAPPAGSKSSQPTGHRLLRPSSPRSRYLARHRHHYRGIPNRSLHGCEKAQKAPYRHSVIDSRQATGQASNSYRKLSRDGSYLSRRSC